MNDLLIWWISGNDCELIGDNLDSDHIPSYICDQYRSRIGRDGRGRLWIEPSLGFQGSTTKAFEVITPLTRYLEILCGGIMFLPEHKHHFQNLPGVITNLKLQRV